ncbi:MAG: cysteine hydrolase [Anaerolineae bacterium]|nr:cysteine hydrolase [Anaerolineae bacterium]
MNTKNTPYTREEVISLASRAYQKGQASFEMDLNHTALLVIDMQAEFTRAGWAPCWVPAATDMLPHLTTFLQTCRQAALPVIHTAFAATHAFLDRPASGASMPNRYPDLPDDGLFQTAVFAPGLEPLPTEMVILKPSYGAFYDTPLDTILRNLKVHTVIVTGTLTNLCCGTTARQAYERGYRVIFVSDLTATNSEELQQAELQTQRYAFSRVMSCAELTDWIKNR